MTIIDATQREQALNPTESFIVQAPAGSGKTELLTQRFLRLLTCVDQYPEEIIAITFTRKAANEMRNRIISALQRAADEPMPESAHGQRTWKLARQALEKSQQFGWDLLNNPNRLRIQTIDAFCAYLSAQMPILANLGADLPCVDDASRDYEQAAKQLLITLEYKNTVAAAAASLLGHLDNNVSTVKDLLCAMLAHRDQWLPYVLHARQQIDLRQQLETTLQTVIEDHLQALNQQFTAQQQQEIIALLTFATEILNADNHQHHFSLWDQKRNFPQPQFEQLPYWRLLTKLLLTHDETWRARIDKNLGFPPKGETKTDTERFKCYKNRFTELLADLSQNEELRYLLAGINTLPDAHYPENQWQALLALCELLPYLVAELQLVFQQKAHVDFIEISQRALQALGDLENPSDLALCLDYRIKHLLVDEFQDTSVSQFRLLTLITRSWQPDDGRTLFLVGDPMQSIYRFRAAEVGLFLRAKQHGINQLQLTPLILQTNFRSQAAIVDWVNHTFLAMFPRTENIALGAIPYTASTAVHAADKRSPVFLHSHNDEQREGHTIVQIIQQARLNDPVCSIAILVQARSHLYDILPDLNAAQIPYQAVDIEPLLTLPYIQDLTTLTRALLHLGDRIAWLAMLRAPWCGLTLTDLHTIGCDAKHTIWHSMTDPTLQQKLSADGLQRLQKMLTILQPKITQVGRYPFTALVKKSWLLLSGPATLTEHAQLKHTQVFFDLLEKLVKNEVSINQSLLEEKLARLYAQPGSKPNAVQIMTIHKAKGLEFDVVILPKLAAPKAADKSKLLLWQERPSAENEVELLLAPIKSREKDEDKIYQYIKYYEKQKQDFESARLFYVAATRAKQQLHLLATLPTDEKEPASNSFLGKIYQQQGTQFQQHLTPIVATTNIATPPTGNLHRLPSSFFNPLASNPFPRVRGKARMGAIHIRNIPLWQNETPRHIGTVLHFILQTLSQAEKTQWPTLIEKKDSWRILLLQTGVPNTELETSLTTIHIALQKILYSPHAQWLLDKSKPDAQSEFPISYYDQTEWKNYIIDRTFIDNGIRWIIDYKISQPAPDESINDFLNKEKDRYQTQLRNYAKTFQKESESIKLALYFPLVDELISWVYT